MGPSVTAGTVGSAVDGEEESGKQTKEGEEGEGKPVKLKEEGEAEEEEKEGQRMAGEKDSVKG